MACGAAVALLLAVAPVAVVLSGGNPAPQTWQRLTLVGGMLCLLAAAGGFWLGPDRTLRLLADAEPARPWRYILLGICLNALILLVWRFAG